MSNTVIPDSIRRLFVAAGWSAGRRVKIPIQEFGGFPIFAAAENLLAEFGDLRVGSTKSGRDCASSDVHFDPAHIEESAESIAPFQAQLDTRLFPLGSAHLDYMTLFADEQGRIYSIDLPTGEFWLIALSFATAMEALLLGIHPEGSDGIRGLKQILPHAQS